jgi:hypothetical protein
MALGLRETFHIRQHFSVVLSGENKKTIDGTTHGFEDSFGFGLQSS